MNQQEEEEVKENISQNICYLPSIFDHSMIIPEKKFILGQVKARINIKI